MPSFPFVHLRSHSEFSVVDGIARIPNLVSRAVASEQPAMALTDLCNLFGLIKFYKEARKKGIKAIAGSDLWVENEHDREKPFRLLVLVMNHQGYLDLCDLLTKAWLENQYKGRGEVRREWLENQQNLILLSGARMGDIGQAIDAGNADLAREYANFWAEHYPNRFFIESGISRDFW